MDHGRHGHWEDHEILYKTGGELHFHVSQKVPSQDDSLRA